MTEEEYRKRINHIDRLVRSYVISQETAGKLIKNIRKEKKIDEKTKKVR
jgi:hypothetical protein